MALAAFLGLALGVAALVISLALLSGFQSHIRGRLLEETPHLQILPSGRGDFILAEGIGERLGRVAGVASVSPVVRGRLWISVRGQSVPAEAVGRENAEGLRLDPQHARTLGAYTGDEVLLVSSRSRLSPLGPVPIVASMRIEEVLSSPAGRRIPEVVLPIREAGRLFALAPGQRERHQRAPEQQHHFSDVFKHTETAKKSNATTKSTMLPAPSGYPVLSGAGSAAPRAGAFVPPKGI